MVKLEIRGNLLNEAMIPMTYIYWEATLVCSSCGLSIQISDPERLIVATLEIKPSAFVYFSAEEHVEHLGIDFYEFRNTINTATADESITISTVYNSTDGDTDEDNAAIRIVFKDLRTELTRSVELKAIDPDRVLLATNPSQYVYEVIVGIPSRYFRRIFTQFRSLGETVSVTVTDTKVMFSQGDNGVVLSTENGKCIIGGAVSEDPVFLTISLYYFTSFRDASLLSSTVWIFYANSLPGLLNCPAGNLGHLMFYFV